MKRYFPIRFVFEATHDTLENTCHLNGPAWVAVFEILAVMHPIVSTPVSAKTERCVSGSDAACQACSRFRLAWSSQPQPSTYPWDCPQTAIAASLCLPSSHHPSSCPSSLAIGVWTSGLGKWQEEFTKLTRQMSSGSVFYPDVWA